MTTPNAQHPATAAEPTTKAGQKMESWLREPEDYQWGRDITDAILAIEREARAAAIEQVRAALQDAGWREDSPHPDKGPIAVGWGLLESDLARALDAAAGEGPAAAPTSRGR